MKSETRKNQSESQPKQVYYVWNYLEWGGAQVYFLGIAARIKDRVRVKFIFPRETNPQFIGFCEDYGLEYEFLDAPSADLQPATTLKRKLERHLNKLKAERALLGFLSKFDFSDAILHIELTPWQSVRALLALRRRATVFITMHNALPPAAGWRRRLWKQKFALVTKYENFHIFASNQDAKNSLEPFVSARFLQKVKVTYTNVNPDEIDEALAAPLDRDALLEKFDLPKDKFLVFSLGQFIDRKGRWVFLEAARKVLTKTRDVGFVWISNSVLTDEERAKIESFGLGNSFSLLKSEDVGRTHLELMKFLRAADVYALPSYVEGLPISLLEAMALGIPSISTDVYAIPEAVKDKRTGILIEAGDSDALAEAILKLHEDRNLREKLSSAGRAWVLNNFNEKSVAEIAFAAYREALAQKK